MNLINIRTPYSIIITDITVNSKVELFLWNNGTAEPTVPTYTFSSKIPSALNNSAEYNISNECKEFINFPQTLGLFPDTVETDYGSGYCQVKVNRYRDENLLDTTYYTAVDGYNFYNQNVNHILNGDALVLSDNIEQDIPLSFNYQSYINVIYENITEEINEGKVMYNNKRDEEINVFFDIQLGIYVYAIPLYNSNMEEYNYTITIYNSGSPIFTKKINQICETKYTPMLVQFINRFGGWENIYCFKAKEDSIQVKATEFKTNFGESKVFNKNGERAIRVNTGWVNEDMKILIEQLYLSETIFLDGVSVSLKNKTTVLKKEIKERNINYTFEFDYNYSIINDTN